jgi:two-component system chemotaxis response regulator CheY
MMRALVIDDSKTMRMIVCNILKQIGFETVEAKHGLDALDQLQKSGRFDMAMVDWNMPEMNGFDFVVKVRSDHSFDDMRLVMVTTETEMAHVARALEAGANEYVMKPFTKDIIIEKLSILGISPA